MPTKKIECSVCGKSGRATQDEGGRWKATGFKYRTLYGDSSWTCSDCYGFRCPKCLIVLSNVRTCPSAKYDRQSKATKKWGTYTETSLPYCTHCHNKYFDALSPNTEQ